MSRMVYTHDNVGDRILDSITEGVFTVDRDMNIKFFNSSAERITGVSRHEAIGKKCYDVFRANICQATCALQRSLETGEDIENLKAEILTHKGAKLPISISTSVLKDDNGQIIGGVETFRDISTIEALRKEIAKGYVFEDIISKNYKIYTFRF